MTPETTLSVAMQRMVCVMVSVDQLGLRPRSCATAPATCGVATGRGWRVVRGESWITSSMAAAASGVALVVRTHSCERTGCAADCDHSAIGRVPGSSDAGAWGEDVDARTHLYTRPWDVKLQATVTSSHRIGICRYLLSRQALTYLTRTTSTLHARVRTRGHYY